MLKRQTLLSALGLIGFLAVWEVLSRSGVMQANLAPPPSSVPPALLSEIRNGAWFAAVKASLGHYSIGLVIGSALGVVAGVAVALWPRVEHAQAWVARLLRPIPPLAWIPFAIIWFGVSEMAAVFIIAIGVFWLNYFTTASAVQAVDRNFIELAQAFGHRGLGARLAKVILPAASPGILAGLRSSLGQGWMTVVAAELFGIPGIGQRMMEASGLLATNVVVLYMLTIAFFYGLTDLVFVRFMDRALLWTRKTAG